ncbi:MAG: hypothetical protein K1X89_13045, partial [Myxococcaceae bacterium]|nr:hypothetical protein [Myxococcaceae bacterium]
GGGGSAGGGSAGGGRAGGGSAGGGQPDGGRTDGGTSDGGGGGSAKFCEVFETYATGALSGGATLGPWKVNVADSNGTVSIDGTHVVSGSKALKVHINNGASSGGQLRTKASPLFSPARPQLYGRFMMYLANGAGTSQHWTMFGAAGTVPDGPTMGHHATYLYSAFASSAKNSYGEVYYDDQTAQDCWHTSNTLMPLDKWTCVAFSVDGPNKAYRFWLDGTSIPGLSVNTTGDGCVAHPAATPWYGPNFDEFYIGALSFHPMTASLDLWIDDVVLDTSPVACP